MTKQLTTALCLLSLVTLGYAAGRATPARAQSFLEARPPTKKSCLTCAGYQSPDPVNQCIRGGHANGCYGHCDERGFCTCYPDGWCDPWGGSPFSGLGAF